MKKALLLTGVLLALCATAALAAGPPGLNLAWTTNLGGQDNCPSQPVNLSDNVDNCATVTGAGANHILVASCVVPPGAVAVTGEDVFIDLQVASAVLDQYWHLETGGCRAGKMTASADFSLYDQTTCTDYWAGQASGGANWSSGYGGPNRARFEAVFAIQPALAKAISAGTEIYLVAATIKGQYSSGTPNTTGCLDCHTPGCFVLNECDLSQPAGVGDIKVTNQSVRQFATWQGGANTNCPTSTPTRKSTWGEMKSLYR